MYKIKNSLIDDLVVTGLILVLLYCGWVIFNSSKYTKELTKNTVEVVMTKDELLDKLKSKENELKVKQEQIDKLSLEVNELSYLKRMQKDIARIYDGRKD